MLNGFRAWMVLTSCLGIAAILATVPAGCASQGGRASKSARRGTAPPAADVDPSRAYLSLEQIEPTVERPDARTPLPPLPEKAAGQVAKAQQKVAQQRYTEAAIDLERALRRHPKHPVIHRTLANLHWQAGNIERARKHARQAVELYPDDATAHFILGRCASLNADDVGAINAFRAALLCGDFDEHREAAILTHFHLAEALVVEGYLQAALGEYEAFELSAQAVADPPSRRALATLLRSTGGSAGASKAKIFERLGRLAEAADAYAPVAAASGDLETTTRYARLLAGAGRYDDALDVARRMPSKDERAVIRLMFDIYQAAGRPSRIIDDLRIRLANRPDDEGLVVAVSEMLAQLKRAEDAVAELHRFVDTHPGAYRVRVKILDIQIAAKLWTAALEVAAEIIHQHPDRASTIAERVVRLAEHEDAVAAILDEGIPDETIADEGDDRADGEFAAAFLRGVLAAEANRQELARQWLEKAYAINDASVDVRVALARVYLRAYDYGMAMEVAGRRDEEVPEHAALEVAQGDILERLDKVDDAEGHYRSALQLDRDDRSAMFALAKLFARSGRSLKAQRRLRVVLNNDPNHAEARELLALNYLREGKIDAGVQQLNELKQKTDDPNTLARVEALLSQFPNRNPLAYRERLLDAVREGGADASLWLAIAESYDRATEAELAHEAYENALDIDPDNEDAAFSLSVVEQRLLEFEKSAQRLELLLPRRPNRHSWRRRLIETYWTTQEFEKALALARQQEKRDDIDEKTRFAYRMRIVDSLRFAGKTGEGLGLLESWVKDNPDSDNWKGRLANAYVLDDQPKRAVPILTERFERSPDDRTSLQRLVEVLVTAGEADRAMQYALDWVHQDPENDAAVALLVTTLQGDDRVDDVIELCRNTLLRSLNRQFFQNLIIQNLRQARRHEECITFVDSLIDSIMQALQPANGRNALPAAEPPGVDERMREPNPNATGAELEARLSELRLNLAVEYILARDFREAEEMLVSWLEASRDARWRFQYLRWLVQCYQGMGDEERAVETLERALLLQPDHVTFNNDLAYTLADKGTRLDEAERLIRFALWRAPRQGAYLDTFGWVLYKKGQFKEATKWLERANHANVQGDPVLLDHLGDAYWRQGRKDDALKYWGASIDSLKDVDENRMIAADMRRVRDATPAKMDAAKSGGQPKVAHAPGEADDTPADDGS